MLLQLNVNIWLFIDQLSSKQHLPGVWCLFRCVCLYECIHMFVDFCIQFFQFLCGCNSGGWSVRVWRGQKGKARFCLHVWFLSSSFFVCLFLTHTPLVHCVYAPSTHLNNQNLSPCSSPLFFWLHIGSLPSVAVSSLALCKKKLQSQNGRSLAPRCLTSEMRCCLPLKPVLSPSALIELLYTALSLSLAFILYFNFPHLILCLLLLLCSHLFAHLFLNTRWSESRGEGGWGKEVNKENCVTV